MAGAERQGARYRRCGDVEVREADGNIFLAGGSANEIYLLDPLATAFWRLLEQPQTLDEVGAVFAAAFPDVPPAQLAKDIRNLAATLERAGMVQTG